MEGKQLKTVINQIEALKTSDRSEDFNAGVSAAQAVITTILQEAADRERMQKLEAELTELRSKYPTPDQVAPKETGSQAEANHTDRHSL